jgi:hypothetical protein
MWGQLGSQPVVHGGVGALLDNWQHVRAMGMVQQSGVGNL